MNPIAPKPLMVLDYDKVFATDFKTRLHAEGLDDIEFTDDASTVESQIGNKGSSHIWIIDYLSLKGQTENMDVLMNSIVNDIKTHVFILFPPDTQDLSGLVPAEKQQVMGLIKGNYTALMISSILKKGFAAHHLMVQKKWFILAVGAFVLLLLAELVLLFH